MDDQKAAEFLEFLERKVQALTGQRLVFFVIGRAGWGKSSTVNSLVGQDVCKVDDNEPTTTEVTGFNFEMNGVKAIIFDTPGLCDGSGNDQIYIEKIRSQVTDPDSMLYINRLDETRLTDNDRRGIKIISEALGTKIWENAVIVFTFANKESVADYQTKLTKRTQIIRQAIADCIQNTDIAYNIPAVAIDNKSDTTPDGKEWLGEFFTVVAERVSMKGMIAFLSFLTPSITKRTHFNKQQKGIIRRKFVEAVLQSTGTAMGIGVAIAGLLNAPIIIGFSGAGIVGALIGTWLSRYDDE
ncbi:50S ribosome-binding GTPase [Microcoleus sp. AT8-B4]|uniref:GTPase n=1 Tax=Microcoleus sp. AT8-B4 TaxID=2818620 RepID=UPI002FD58480